MTDGYGRSRDMAFFVMGLVGAVLAYYGMQAGFRLYEWVTSTDVVANIVSWWTTQHTVTIVPIEVFWSLTTLMLMALIIWIPLYVMLYDPYMFH